MVIKLKYKTMKKILFGLFILSLASCSPLIAQTPLKDTLQGRIGVVNGFSQTVKLGGGTKGQVVTCVGLDSVAWGNGSSNTGFVKGQFTPNYLIYSITNDSLADANFRYYSNSTQAASNMFGQGSSVLAFGLSNVVGPSSFYLGNDSLQFSDNYIIGQGNDVEIGSSNTVVYNATNTGTSLYTNGTESFNLSNRAGFTFSITPGFGLSLINGGVSQTNIMPPYSLTASQTTFLPTQVFGSTDTLMIGGDSLKSNGYATPHDLYVAFINSGMYSTERIVATTGGSVQAVAQVLWLTPVSTITTFTITLPASPTNGQIFRFNTTQTITSITLQAGTGGASIQNSFTTLNANSFGGWVYDLSDNAWMSN